MAAELRKRSRYGVISLVPDTSPVGARDIVKQSDSGPVRATLSKLSENAIASLVAVRVLSRVMPRSRVPPSRYTNEPSAYSRAFAVVGHATRAPAPCVAAHATSRSSDQIGWMFLTEKKSRRSASAVARGSLGLPGISRARSARIMSLSHVGISA